MTKKYMIDATTLKGIFQNLISFLCPQKLRLDLF